MMIYAVIALVIVLSGGIATGRQRSGPGGQQTDDFRGIECKALKDPEEIVECALMQFRAGSLGKLEFSSLLSEAKAVLPHTHTFWGGGLITGDSYSIAFGKMNDFTFESVWKIPIRLPVYGDWAPEVLLPEASGKPLAIYSTTTFQAPRINRNYFVNWKNSGGEYHKAALRISDEDKVGLPLRENCDAVDADKDIEWMRKESGSAILLPGNRWCVSKISVDFDIYVGSLMKKEVFFGGSKREMFVFQDGWLKAGTRVTRFGKPEKEVFP